MMTMMNQASYKGNDNKIRKSSTLAVFSAGAVIVMLITAMVSFFLLAKRMDQVKELNATENFRTYDKYVCMVTSDDDSVFWTEVYNAAVSEGEEKGIYVDMVSDTISKQDTPEELLKIVIAAKPDGIIVEANNSEEMNKLLEEADKADIPVVTVLSDGEASHRISYVSVNSYTLGQIYGSQVMGVAENNANVLILTRSRTSGMVGEELIITGIQDTIMASEEYRNINISTSSIVDEDAFAIEESVRNIFMGSEQLPDVIVCLDELITTCVYQAMIDYNKVGALQLLGYYNSDTIIEGVRRDVIHSTIAVDTKSMGRDCIDAFSEYWETGYVSEFYDVDSQLITSVNVDDIIKEEATNARR